MFDSDLSTLMTYNPDFVSPDTALAELMHLVEQTHIAYWPVLDGDRCLLGIVSDVDIVQYVRRFLATFAAVCESASDESDWVPRQVSDIMSRNVFSVDHQDSTKKALRMLIDHRIHSLPVTDDGRLFAMLTSTDFIRELSYGQVAISREGVPKFMTPVPESIDVDENLDAAEEQFQKSEADYLCILQGDFPLGVVSRRDVRRAKCRELTNQLLGNDLSGGEPTTVAQLVQQSPTVMPGHSLHEVAARMFNAHKQAIAVVNRANRLLGVITEDNILRSLLYDGI